MLEYFSFLRFLLNILQFLFLSIKLEKKQKITNQKSIKTFKEHILKMVFLTESTNI